MKKVTTTTTKTTNTSRNRRRRRNNRQRSQPINATQMAQWNQPGVQVRISSCSRDYLRALTNPFQLISPMPCIPDVLTLPSQKVRVEQRGTFAIGTLGVGFVALAAEQSLWNNINSVTYTISTFTGNTFNLSGATPTGVNRTPILNTPFVSTNSSWATEETTQARLVGIGIRIRYDGPVLDQSGTTILFRSSGGYVKVMAPSTALSQPTSGYGPVRRQWDSITYIPDEPDQLGYRPINTILAKALVDSANLIIFVSGAKPGVSFSYEISGYWEVLGLLAWSPSASHSDPVGMGAVISSLPQKASTKTPNQVEQSTFSKVASTLLESSSGVLPLAARVVGAGLKAYMQQGNKMLQITGPVVTDAD